MRDWSGAEDWSALEALAQVRLFEGLGDQVNDQLRGMLRRGTYDRGQVIVEAEDECTGVCAIISGSARIVQRTDEGKEAVFGTMGPGDVYGLVSLASGRPVPCGLEAAVDETVAYRAPRAAFSALVASDPNLALAINRVLGQRLATLLENQADLLLCDVETRVAHALARYARHGGDSLGVGVIITHEQLAAGIGTGRSDVTRALRPLRERGLICEGRRRSSIVVLDPEGLAEYQKL